MTCNQCNISFVEITRYDGDKIVSTRWICPICGNGAFNAVAIDELLSDTTDRNTELAHTA